MKRTTSFSPRLIGALSTGLLLIAAIVVFDHDRLFPRFTATTAVQSRPRFSQQELERFLADDLQAVKEFVLNGKFRIPELGERYRTLIDLIKV